MTKKTVSDNANHYGNMLKIIDGDNGKEAKIIPTKEASEEFMDMVRNAHGDLMPCNFVYNTINRLLLTVEDYQIKTIEELEEKESEIIEACVDVMTGNLTDWLASNTSNVYYLSQALEDNGEPMDGFSLLSYAQYLAISEIWQAVKNLLIK